MVENHIKNGMSKAFIQKSEKMRQSKLQAAKCGISVLVMGSAASLLIYDPVILLKRMLKQGGNDGNQNSAEIAEWQSRPTMLQSDTIFHASAVLSVGLPDDDDESLEQTFVDTIESPIMAHDKNYKVDYLPSDKGVPRFDKDCVPIKDWQVEQYPTCNLFHSLDFSDINLLGVGGDRVVWKLGQDKALKTTKLKSFNTRKNRYYSWRTDALVSEKLTASPRVVDIYGHCALATLNQVGTVKPKWHRHLKGIKERFELALQLARALRDVHSIDGGNVATVVWRNMKPENILFVNDSLRITDFDESILLYKHRETEKLCKFHLTGRAKPYQPIEQSYEANALDEKADIYSLGAMLYAILTGGRPYGGMKLVEDQLKRDGILPEFPRKLPNDTLTATLRNVTIQCMAQDSRKRPSARQVVRELERAWQNSK